jgi:aarF domain-containing kinase
MSGRRLLDAAALFNASRAVASQHLSIRLRQLDVYSKTSTFAKALKRQTNSAAQATSSSALRSSPSTNGASSRQTYGSKSGATAAERIPSLGSVQDDSTTNESTEGLEQDHHYRPQGNSVVDDVPEEELQVQQEKANRYPLPDGTIPTGEAALGKMETNGDVHNQWSASETAKNHLKQHEAPSKTLEPKSSGNSTIPDPNTMSSADSGASAPTQESVEPSVEMVNQIFHSPRVARLLGSKGQFGSPKPNNVGSSRRKSTVAGGRKGMDDSNTWIEAKGVASSFSNGESTNAPGVSRGGDDVPRLAADIEKDARTSSTVCKSRTRSRAMLIN